MVWTKKQEELKRWFLEKNREYNKRDKENEWRREWNRKRRIKFVQEHKDEIEQRKKIKKEISEKRHQIRSRRYLIKKNGGGGSHTLEEWEAKKKEFKYCCAICKKKEPFKDQHFKELTEDHIIPVSKWQEWIKNHPEIEYQCNDIENIQPACHRCNCLKQAELRSEELKS